MSRTGGAAILGGGSVLRIGRPFMSPMLDLMLIGGGASLLVVLGLAVTGRIGPGGIPRDLMLSIVLISNSAHFASSTVRLYTKPGSFQSLPVMTMGFPLISLGALALGLIYADIVGYNIYALYLTWSPYHYAAQTFGLASMYAVRSGCKLSSSQRRLLWLTCMVPFVFSFLKHDHTGLGMFLPAEFFVDHPELRLLRLSTMEALRWVVFAAPVLLFVRVYQQSRIGLPLICVSLMLTNAIWWAVFDELGAVMWATVFHGVQYLAIVVIFHLRDHPPKNTGRSAWLLPALKFYGLSLGLAYLLFEVWPYFFTLAGFPFSESVLLCVAVINIHHFLVDRGIWQIRKDASNRTTVVS